MLDELGLGLWTPDDPHDSPLLVDKSGEIFVRTRDDVLNLQGQPSLLSSDILGLTAPFRQAGEEGPDLIRPRPHLRIVPTKVAGEPHIQDSRVTTQTVAALAARGFLAEQIASMYSVGTEAVSEGIDLERQLSGVPLVA